MFIAFIAVVIAFAVSFFAVPVIISIANKTGAIALPGRRHMHTRPTPKLGGIAIGLSVFLSSFFIFQFNRDIAVYLAASSFILLLGIIDDVRGSNWKQKLLSSLIAISILIFGGDMWIKSLGNLFGNGDIKLGFWGIPFTYFAVFGVTSSINLMDGLNGLACGVSTIAFISFAIFAYIDNNTTAFYLSLINLAAILGLFRYNYPEAKIFMGDSGSLFAGFSLSVVSILLTQGNRNVDPMTPVLILGIPIFDALRVMSLRILNKKHPFRADKSHIHHLMVRSSSPPTLVVKIIWILSVVLSLLAFALKDYDSWLMLLIFLLIVVILSVFIEDLRIIKRKRR